MTAPKVSVLMLAYNHERYIEQAVRSVIGQQTDFDFEILVGEDSSSDRTREILRGLVPQSSDRLKVLERERNYGGPENFVRTFAACQGEYVAILEGDDFWTDQKKLARQVSALQQNPQWSLCFHRALRVDENNQTVGRPIPHRVPRETTTEDILSVNYVPTCSVMLRRSAVPVLPDWWVETVIGDWPLCMLASEKGALGFLPEVMAAYRVHSRGTFSAQTRLDQCQRLAHMMRIMRRHFAGRHESKLLRMESVFLLRAARELASVGKGDDARQVMLDAFDKAILSLQDGLSDEAALERALATAGFIRPDPVYNLSRALKKLKVCQWGGRLLMRVWPRTIIPD